MKEFLKTAKKNGIPVKERAKIRNVVAANESRLK